MAHFISAYRQITPVEKSFVDKYVEEIETRSTRERRRVSEYLGSSVTAEEIERSDGLLIRPLVNAAIAERLAKISADRELSADRVLKEWISLAFSNQSDYMTTDHSGEPRYDLTKVAPEQMAAVKKVKFTRSPSGAEQLEFELYDKIAALRVLSDMVGLTSPDSEFMRSELAKTIQIPDKSASVADLVDLYSETLNG